MTGCFVPGCKSNSKLSKRTGQKISFFRPPLDKNHFDKWQRSIPRDDRPLTRNDRICHLHFTAEQIQYFFVHIINGEIVRIPRGQPSLTESAYPCIFPNLPLQYTQIPNSTEVTELHIIESPTPSQGLLSPIYCGLNLDELPSLETNSRSTFSCAELKCNINQISLPSMEWGRHINEENNTIVFSHIALTSNGFTVDKLVSFNETLTPKFSNNIVFVPAPNGCLDEVHSLSDVETIIRYLDARKVCPGIISVPVVNNFKETVVFQINKKCKLFFKEQNIGELCWNCEAELKRRIKLQRNAVKNKTAQDEAKKRLHQINKQLACKIARLEQ